MKAVRSNNLHLGLLLGLIAPSVVYFIIYLVGFKNITFFEFFNLLNEKNVFTKVLSLCALANLLVFFIFYHCTSSESYSLN
jgi:hypothetical protein